MFTASRTRLALKAALCLLGGVVATVLIAWGFVLWGPARSVSSSACAMVWPGAAPFGYPPVPGGALQELAAGSRFTTASRWDADNYWQGWRLECGWPLIALDLETFTHATHTTGFDVVEHWPPLPRPTWIPATNDSSHDALPTRPVPTGFALDTFFYAAILATLFFAPPALRRHFRLRRGLCPACAYNLIGNTTGTCPECGRAP